jgi:penicillin-binding protein activator
MKMTRLVKYSILFLVLLSACTVSTREVAPDEKVIYDEGYHFSDKKAIVATMVKSLLSKPPLQQADDRPVLIVYGIANRTDEHISTSAITDDIRQALLETGRVRFVNENQRRNIETETGYQYGGNVAAETRIEKSRQVGAKYMLTGTLRSMKEKEPKQARFKKHVLRYYSLNMELTDITTGLIEWADSAEVIREASKPFIGW